MSLLLTFSFLVIAVLLFWPGVGVVSRWREAKRRQARMRREDALKHILKSEVNGHLPTLHSVTGVLHISDDAAAEVLTAMERRKLISYTGGKLSLLESGRKLALHIVRAHRLWESYLAEETGVDEAQWHRLAEQKEHQLSPEEASDLEAKLGHPIMDPHGDVIPVLGGELDADEGQPLNTAPINKALEIVHIEDEPIAVYRQLLALGLRPAMRVCILAKESDFLTLWAEGQELALAPILANNIGILPIPEVKAADLLDEEYLSDLQIGEQARVLGLSATCRGAERRRLLDLGFVAGTMISVELPSPTGDSTAYIVRGTMIALRREQARMISIGQRVSVTESALSS
ncbi:MAG: DNA-binding protein [Opitutaceae bacterium]|nr:DNA-binding protein [Opitutaceae bacterium]